MNEHQKAYNEAYTVNGSSVAMSDIGLFYFIYQGSDSGG